MSVSLGHLDDLLNVSFNPDSLSSLSLDTIGAVALQARTGVAPLAGATRLTVTKIDDAANVITVTETDSQGGSVDHHFSVLGLTVTDGRVVSFQDGSIFPLGSNGVDLLLEDADRPTGQAPYRNSEGFAVQVAQLSDRLFALSADGSPVATGTGAPHILEFFNGGPVVDIAQALAMPTAQNLIIIDDAAHIQANYDALKGLRNIGELILAHDAGTPPTLTLTASQYASEFDARIEGAYALVVTGSAADMVSAGFPFILGDGGRHLEITDSAADLLANMGALAQIVANRNPLSITLTDSGMPILSLSAAQYEADLAVIEDIAGKIMVSIDGAAPIAPQATAAQALALKAASPVAVTDSDLNVQNDLDALQALSAAGDLGVVTLNSIRPGGKPSIILDEAQLSRDAGLLSHIAGDYDLTVTGVDAAHAATIGAMPHVAQVDILDSLADLLANEGALAPLIASGRKLVITLTDPNDSGAFTAAQFSADLSLLEQIPHGLSAAVTDSGAAILSHIGDLASWSSLGFSLSITLTDRNPVLALTSAQLASAPYQEVLSHIATPFEISIDGGAPIQRFVTVVQALAALPDHPVPILDSAAHVQAGFDALHAFNQTASPDGALIPLGAIVLTDAAPAITLSAAQLIEDGDVLGHIAGRYALTVTGVAAAYAPIVAAQANVSVLDISDTASHVAGNLDELAALAAEGKSLSIALTDAGIPTFALTAAQMTADAGVLGSTSGPFQLSVDASQAGIDVTGIVGHATVLRFTDVAAHYAIAAAGDGAGLTVTDIATGRTSVDHLRDITELAFADSHVFLASAPGTDGSVTSGNVAALYSAVLSRQPDAAGLAYYQNEARTVPGATLLNFAERFLASPEYGNNPAHAYAQSMAGDSQFIADSYRNLLHRTASAGEIAYYQDNVMKPTLADLTPGTQSYAAAQMRAHAQMLVYFSASPEFLQDVTVTAVHPPDAQHFLYLI